MGGINNMGGVRSGGDGETIHHVITTDDGQTVSMDINLKILSPRLPGDVQSPRHPLPPTKVIQARQSPAGRRGGSVQLRQVSKGSSKTSPQTQRDPLGQTEMPDGYVLGNFVPRGYMYHGGTGAAVPVNEMGNQYIYYAPVRYFQNLEFKFK